jgi:hypothetical protein
VVRHSMLHMGMDQSGKTDWAPATNEVTSNFSKRCIASWFGCLEKRFWAFAIYMFCNLSRSRAFSMSFDTCSVPMSWVLAILHV